MIRGNSVAKGFSDFRVVLRFFNLIRGGGLPFVAKQSTILILITKDSKFFGSAAAQAKTKRNSPLLFNKGNKSISCGRHELRILNTKFKKTLGLDAMRRALIRDLNTFAATISESKK